MRPRVDAAFGAKLRYLLARSVLESAVAFLALGRPEELFGEELAARLRALAERAEELVDTLSWGAEVADELAAIARDEACA
jgi:hypothetical protein